MSLNLQQHLMTLISEVASGIGFLNLVVKSNFTDAVTLVDYTLATTLSYVFLSADMLLYVGIIAVIVVLGLSYR